jgi:osmotically-inducible protein OsmY
MRTDAELEQEAMSELRGTPNSDTKDIALKVQRGVVVLTGFARAYRDKLSAEDAVRRIVGVRGIANAIQVRDTMDNAPSDPQTAREAAFGLGD